MLIIHCNVLHTAVVSSKAKKATGKGKASKEKKAKGEWELEIWWLLMSVTLTV